jgi:peptide chain release factor subunit 1
MNFNIKMNCVKIFLFFFLIL